VTPAGVDGCRAGWLVADESSVTVVARFADVLRRGYSAIAVDMPVVLPERGIRACDTEARTRLGARRSSIFATPVRAVLGARTYADALARSRAVDGRGLSAQAFNLLPSIADIDATISGTDPVFEASPELSFAAMAGAPRPHPKRHPAGVADRTALILAHVVEAVPATPKGARADDVLDAFALLWTARRIVAGTAESLGDSTPVVDR
jgi:predicted RNase H-like nuclease